MQDRTGADREIAGAKPSAVRRVNERALLTALRTRGPATIAELASLSGLQVASVRRVLFALSERDLVRTDPARPAGRGRPAVTYALAARGQRSLGIELGPHRIRAVVTGPRGGSLERHEAGITEPTRSAVATAVDRLLGSFSVAGIDLVGATGVAVPGRVGPDGRVTLSVSLGDWRGHRVAEVLAEVAPGTVLAVNDITALTSAETRAQLRAGERHAMVIHLGRRPTIGVIVDGARYDGAHGQAGDLSRLRLPAITSLVGDGPAAEARLDDVLSAAAAGEQDAVATLTGYTDDVFGALINTIAVVDPAVVIVAGPLQRAAARFLPDWTRRAAGCLQIPPRFVSGSFDEFGIATGAALIAAEHLDRQLTEIS